MRRLSLRFGGREGGGRLVEADHLCLCSSLSFLLFPTHYQGLPEPGACSLSLLFFFSLSDLFDGK